MNRKLTKYIIIMSGLSLLFYFAGLTQQTNPLINVLLQPQNMSSSYIILTILGVIATAVASVVIGFFSGDNTKYTSGSLIIPLLISFLWSSIDVFITIYAYLSFFAILILSPLLLMFYITMYEFWRS